MDPGPRHERRAVVPHDHDHAERRSSRDVRLHRQHSARERSAPGVAAFEQDVAQPDRCDASDSGVFLGLRAPIFQGRGRWSRPRHPASGHRWGGPVDLSHLVQLRRLPRLRIRRDVRRAGPGPGCRRRPATDQHGRTDQPRRGHPRMAGDRVHDFPAAAFQSRAAPRRQRPGRRRNGRQRLQRHHVARVRLRDVGRRVGTMDRDGESIGRKVLPLAGDAAARRSRAERRWRQQLPDRDFFAPVPVPGVASHCRIGSEPRTVWSNDLRRHP